MASDLISRKALMSMHYDVKCTEVKGEVFVRLEDVVNWIKLIPTVDAVEVVHGWWEMDGVYDRCSVCNRVTLMPHLKGLPQFDYCPNCGAKMDGG